MACRRVDANPLQGSHALWKTQGNGLFMENQGNLREFAKLLREF